MGKESQQAFPHGRYINEKTLDLTSPQGNTKQDRKETVSHLLD
jgi:hypothetical protein